MTISHNIHPIYNKESKILILGSFPSKTSRKEKFYYAHPQNKFWKIINILFNKNLETNEEKKSFLLNNKIALWDIVKQCDIERSNDSSIKNIKFNNLEKIIKNSKITHIFCTGKVAYNLLIKNFKFNIPTTYLPSPSSANAKYSLKDLINIYNMIKNI